MTCSVVWLAILSVAIGYGCMNGFIAWIEPGIDEERAWKATMVQWFALGIVGLLLSAVLLNTAG